MAHVFISYSHEDRDFAEIVISEIKKAEIASWIDSEQLRAGKDWQQQIDDSIRQSFVVLVIMTPDAKKSEYVTYEWSFALGASVPVVPIMRKTVDIHSRLKSVQALDFTGKYRPFADLIDELNRIKDEVKSTKHAKGQIDSDEPVYDVRSVIEDLSSDNLELRIGAAKILGKLKEKTAVPMLMQQINNRWDVAVEAITALGEIGDKSVVPKLIAKFYSLPEIIEFTSNEYMIYDDDANIMLALVTTLGNLKDNLAFDVIRKVFHTYDSVYAMRHESTDALIKINPDEAKKVLWNYLNTRRKINRYYVEDLVWVMSNSGVQIIKDTAIRFCENYPEFSDYLDNPPF